MHLSAGTTTTFSEGMFFPFWKTITYAELQTDTRVYIYYKQLDTFRYTTSHLPYQDMDHPGIQLPLPVLFCSPLTRPIDLACHDLSVVYYWTKRRWTQVGQGKHVIWLTLLRAASKTLSGIKLPWSLQPNRSLPVFHGVARPIFTKNHCRINKRQRGGTGGERGFEHEESSWYLRCSLQAGVPRQTVLEQDHSGWACISCLLWIQQRVGVLLARENIISSWAAGSREQWRRVKVRANSARVKGWATVYCCLLKKLRWDPTLRMEQLVGGVKSRQLNCRTQ
jgi:hypothetical protein